MHTYTIEPPAAELELAPPRGRSRASCQFCLAQGPRARARRITATSIHSAPPPQSVQRSDSSSARCASHSSGSSFARSADRGVAWPCLRVWRELILAASRTRRSVTHVYNTSHPTRGAITAARARMLVYYGIHPAAERQDDTSVLARKRAQIVPCAPCIIRLQFSVTYPSFETDGVPIGRGFGPRRWAAARATMQYCGRRAPLHT